MALLTPGRAFDLMPPPYGAFCYASEHRPHDVLFIDANDADRTYFVERLKRCSSDYRILEATDGESGLELYRSERVDCVVLAIELPDCSGFRVLVGLVPGLSTNRG
jgi:CheY-like chemotaxis protein